jgi:hypothetical protein
MDAKTPGRPSPLLPWAIGILFAAIFCSNYLLMFAYRQVWQSHYPGLADQWANNGRFSVIGLYGTELMSEELIYASRVKEASEHLIAFDPYIKENHSKRLGVDPNGDRRRQLDLGRDALPLLHRMVRSHLQLDDAPGRLELAGALFRRLRDGLQLPPYFAIPQRPLLAWGPFRSSRA